MMKGDSNSLVWFGGDGPDDILFTVVGAWVAGSCEGTLVLCVITSSDRICLRTKRKN